MRSGKDNYAADRAVAEQVASAYPDPIVLSHARALLASSPEGATAYIDADLRATGTTLGQAAGVLDFGQPVAVMLLGLLQGIPDQDKPGVIITQLMDAVSPGSYLALIVACASAGSSPGSRGCRTVTGPPCCGRAR